MSFDKVASYYDKSSTSIPWKWYRKKELKYILNEVRYYGPLSVFEVGCGTGFYSKKISSIDIPIRCIDKSERMVEQAEQKGIACEVADICHYRAQSVYEMVLCAGSLEFVKEIYTAKYNILNLLKGDGVLVILAPPHNITGWLYKLTHQIFGEKTYLHNFIEILAPEFILEKRKPVTCLSELFVFRKLNSE